MSPEETPQTPTNLKPSEPQSPSPFPFRSKGVIIAIIIVVVAIVIGVSALIGVGSTSQYQGYIRQIEDTTSDLQDNAVEETSEVEAILR